MAPTKLNPAIERLKKQNKPKSETVSTTVRIPKSHYDFLKRHDLNLSLMVKELVADLMISNKGK